MGKISVLNGKEEKVSVKYTILEGKELLNKKSFQKIADESTKKAKNLMNFPRTFIPVEMAVSAVQKDSIFNCDTNEKYDVFYITVRFKYIAQNAYGIEKEGDTSTSFYTFMDGTAVDIEDFIRLPELRISGDGVNRKLVLYKDEDYIDIGVNKKTILVTSSLSCVDKGTWLTFRLDGGEEFRLESWNSFNCDGYSFFDWFNKSQIELLKKHQVMYISITYKKSKMFILPKNKRDYFMQLVNLY